MRWNWLPLPLSLDLIASTLFIFFPWLVRLISCRFGHSSSMVRTQRERERNRKNKKKLSRFWQMRFGFGICGHTVLLSLWMLFNSVLSRDLIIMQIICYLASFFFLYTLFLVYWKYANNVIIFYSLIFFIDIKQCWLILLEIRKLDGLSFTIYKQWYYLAIPIELFRC